MLRNFQFPIIKFKKRVYEHEDEGEEMRRCATMRERERERFRNFTDFRKFKER